jgi:hypothetical protein
MTSVSSFGTRDTGLSAHARRSAVVACGSASGEGREANGVVDGLAIVAPDVSVGIIVSISSGSRITGALRWLVEDTKRAIACSTSRVP